MKFNLFIFLIGTIAVHSCTVTKPYQSPQQVSMPGFVKNAGDDTTNMATLSWQQIFSDVKLKQHISQALSSNIDILNSFENIRIAQAYLEQSRRAFEPQASVGPQVGYQSPSTNGNFGGTRRHTLQFELGANYAWEADVWGRLRSVQKANLASYLQTEAAARTIHSRLVAELADTYFELLALDQQLLITDSTINNRNKSLETTRALKTAGTLTEVAVKQGEAQLLNAQGVKLSIINQIRLLENYFCLLQGQPYAKVDRTNLYQQPIPATLHTGIPAQLLRNRTDVRAAEYAYMQAFELNNVASAAFYPRLSLSGSTGLQSTDLAKLINPASFFTSLGASFLHPLLNRRQLHTDKTVRTAQQELALNNFKQSILVASREVNDALYNFDMQSSMIQLKQQEFKAYDTAAIYSQELVNYGMANYLEVLRANENAFQARLSYINAYYGRLSALVQLYRSLGGGTN